LDCYFPRPSCAVNKNISSNLGFDFFLMIDAASLPQLQQFSCELLLTGLLLLLLPGLLHSILAWLLLHSASISILSPSAAEVAA
jgi:hypothetical protein